MSDKSAGLAICLVSSALFAYYTVWVLVTPFVQPGHVVGAAEGGWGWGRPQTKHIVSVVPFFGGAFFFVSPLPPKI